MQPNRNRPLIVAVACVALLFVASLATPWFGGANSSDTLVVYCAHDSIFSEQVLQEFEEETGIRVVPRFDTEATKSLGLVNLLIREKDHPRCDVFWNNQVLGTVALQEKGLLHPYKGTGYSRIPEIWKDADGHWTGFAARLRVYIVNTEKMPATEEAVQQALYADLSRMAVANPLYGTTLSHYSVLCDQIGAESLKLWHQVVRQRGVREVEGNATVKNLVAEGVCDWGWTDTDDFFVAKDEGKPVGMLPIRVKNRQTICIPNSVAIIKGTRKLRSAQKLVDYLLSADNELALACSKSRQIPLGPVDEEELPDDVRTLREWSSDAVDLTRLGPARRQCVAWLMPEQQP